MRVSVVIPTFNRKEALRQCLQATLGQSYEDYEVLVVDDGSTDGTRDLLGTEFPQVHFFCQERNYGPATARNIGIRASGGEFVAFTDDDCVPPVDWLSQLVDGYERHPLSAGVGGYLEAPTEILETHILARYERFVARDLYGVGEDEFAGGFECPAGGTNNMSYRRSILEQIGGFDPAFSCAAGEDADLKWRICETGAQLLFVPVKVTHLRAYSWPSFRRQAYSRGKGRACFDLKRGRRSNRARAVLRVIKRALSIPLDLANAERRPFAIVRALEAVSIGRGEWDMIAEMRTWTSSM